MIGIAPARKLDELHRSLRLGLDPALSLDEQYRSLWSGLDPARKVGLFTPGLNSIKEVIAQLDRTFKFLTTLDKIVVHVSHPKTETRQIPRQQLNRILVFDSVESLSD